MTLFYRHADNSIWVEPPPDPHTALIGTDALLAADALARGEIPRLENGALRIYSESNPPLDLRMRNLRYERDLLLAQSDWTQAADAELSQEKVKLWRAYRAALRRIPQQFPTGQNVIWPTKPS